MANSQYEYVKSFEVADEVMPPNVIVVRVEGRDFRRFSDVHEFEKPNDKRALDLMNSCAVAVLEQYPDIVFSYGYGDEYSFIFKKKTKFYQRRARKILSLITSFFTSVYNSKWEEFFPQEELRYTPSFRARVMSCATLEVLQTYLAWRQNECHVSNLYITCLWMMIKHKKTYEQAEEILKDTQRSERNEFLFQQFNVNYKKLPQIFRLGSCSFMTQSEDTVKYTTNGSPVKRMRRRPAVFQCESISKQRFWKEHQSLAVELGPFENEIGKLNMDFIRSFSFEDKLMPFSWIVVRIDGCHFHRFSEVHEFEKPNDERALNLMNSCAVAVLEEFGDIVFAYGVSDEYSFVLKKTSTLFQRQASQIVSVIVSVFTSAYVAKWKCFFPHKQLKYQPSFDGRAVCYPSSQILRDYLAWRQVDCHINNQYNTCFWMLVKEGKSKSEAQRILKGTQTKEKNELLMHKFNIDYYSIQEIFRRGSSVFRLKEGQLKTVENSIDYLKIISDVVDGRYYLEIFGPLLHLSEQVNVTAIFGPDLAKPGESL
ncbi:hypothetical protein MLD38_012360 [Melastoma candidum]|uniref:Uncharacterized protein n=1 Tax=Melastoma candidum TaxID=119954 RepID=A0ACB9R630_9MYRT|nr:hypothetical protein MLD38_012360 [Melastoma candidum]